ncbi:alpha/beta fold hydrolase [Actinomadura rupiterrae]|uniref:alpha/beta fold hydrolase n=1 Tax=Actinomadura rupiterrae TaxID=559627 RepID=UPI0020A3E12A|nr:alpha/beta hydrolase [Actinomadura rupiterrae]MCP2338247.1 pimeloyl-ACP methyl ester carboxylesterase [Actinomadura rupiterrae]
MDISNSFGRRRFLQVSGTTGLALAASAAGGEGAAFAAGGRAEPRGHEIRHRIVQTNGIRMHVAEAGRGTTVLLLHGFPELWYSWRHQLPALAEAGFHAVAPDLRGYGRTTAPSDASDYSLRENLADLTGLLDALSVRTAAVVGHDQGSTIAWAAAQLHPERFTSVVSLGVPYSARLPMPITQLIRENNPGKFNVVLYFQEPGVAEAELNADASRTLRMTMYALSGQAPDDLVPRWLLQSPENSGYLTPLPDPGVPSRWSPWLTDAEFDHYVREFRRTGFDGAIRRYRTFDFDWSDLPSLGTIKVHQPALYVTGDLDSAYRFQSDLTPMRAGVPGLRGIEILPGCGHWTQQERPARVNDLLIHFLRSNHS